MESEGLPREEIDILRDDVLAASRALHLAWKKMESNQHRAHSQLDAQEMRLIDAS
jgi:hypothetical protein